MGQAYDKIEIKIDPMMRELIEQHHGSVQHWINYHVKEKAWMLGKEKEVRTPVAKRVHKRGKRK